MSLKSRFRVMCFFVVIIVSLILVVDAGAQQIWQTDVLKTAIPTRYIGSQSIALDANGYPHIVSNSTNIYYTWFDGTKWNSETILPPGIAGSSAQIAISPDGTVHCVFYYKGDLVHAWKSELGWEFDMPPDEYLYGGIIRIASNGSLHLVYFTEHETITHAVWNNGVWTSEEVDSIIDSKLGLGFDLDSMDQPHLCFYREGNIIYLFRNESVWTEETVMEDVSRSGSLQLRMDCSDNAHIAYHRNTSQNLYDTVYLHWQSGIWKAVVINSGKNEGVNLFLDNNDFPHFALVSDGVLMHVWASENGWDLETVDSSDQYDVTLSGISGDDGLIHVLVRNKTQSCLSYFMKSQSAWDQQVLSSWGYYANSSLAMDQNGNPHVLLTGFNGNQLEHGYLANGNWEFEVLDNGMGDESGQCCIAVDKTGELHVSYYNARRKTVYHAKKVGNEWLREVVFEGEFVFDIKMIVTDPGKIYILISTDNNLFLYRKYSDAWEIDSFEPGEYRSVSIFMDSNEQLHLAYYRAIDGATYERFRLYYRYLEEGIWREELVSSEGDVSGEGMVKVMTSCAGIPLIGYDQNIQGTHSTYYIPNYGFRDEEGWHVDEINYGYLYAWDLDVRGNPCFLQHTTFLFQSDDGKQMSSTFANNSNISPESFLFDPSGQVRLTARNYSDLFYIHQQMPVQGVRLEMSADTFYARGSSKCYLNTYLRSDSRPLYHTPLCILLEYQQNFWFWPAWNDQFNVEYVDVNEKGSVLLAVPSFMYPESPPQPIEGLTFWGALLNDDMTEIFGGPDGIGKWEFSIQ